MALSEALVSQATVGTLLTTQDLVVFAVIVVLSLMFMNTGTLQYLRTMPLLPGKKV
jgi:hypothetical protein